MEAPFSSCLSSVLLVAATTEHSSSTPGHTALISSHLSFVSLFVSRDAHIFTTLLPGSSNFGSPDGSAPSLDGMGVRSSSTAEDKLDDILTRLVQLDTLSQLVSKINLHNHTISSSVGTLRTKVAETEQNLGTLAARILTLEGRDDEVCMKVDVKEQDTSL